MVKGVRGGLQTTTYSLQPGRVYGLHDLSYVCHPVGMALAILLVVASSLLASGILFRHKRVLTYVAAAGTLAEAHWLLLALLSRAVLRQFDVTSVYLGGALVLLVAWCIFVPRWRAPARGSHFLLREAAVVVVVILVLLAAGLIMSFNGFRDGSYITHGFFNGDTLTFGSLVQRSLLSRELIHTNPFAGGGKLEYPTLIHAGVADALVAFGQDGQLLRVLPWLTYLQIALTIPLFFLLWDVVTPEPPLPWQRWYGLSSRPLALFLQAGIVVYVLALSWEGFVYPQGHFFITGLFMVHIALLALANTMRGRWQYTLVVVATVVALLLLLSNAVTGTAAVTLTMVYYLLRANDKKLPVAERVLFLVGVPLWVLLFVLFTPGNGAFGLPRFSYTAAIDMLRLAPIVAVLSLGVVWYLAPQRFLGAACVALIALAFITFFFSTRNIVIENASRFFYHAILVGYPLFMYPLVRAGERLRRELIYTKHSLAELAVGWAVSLVIITFFALPAAASMASAHDNLMFKDEQVVSPDVAAAAAWINKNTDPASVFLASPQPPWSIPLLTGRALLRADYWLSPDDETQRKVLDAFDGNSAAQRTVLPLADYLMLVGEQRSSWSDPGTTPAYINQEVVIYQLK